MASSNTLTATDTECESPHFIPDGLFEQILTRLPVKSLCRFKSVSDPWLRLISSPRFVKIHLLNYSPNFPKVMLSSNDINYRPIQFSPYSLISEQRLTVGSIEYYDLSNEVNMTVVGSCNGLLCLFFGDFPEHELFLWNPCMGNYEELPKTNAEWDIMRGAFGLGYNEQNDDYMVLGIFIGAAKDKRQVEIYSHRTGSWRIVEDFTYAVPVFGIDIVCKFVAGNFHLSIRPVGNPTALYDIVSFDIKNETYGRIGQPNYGGDFKCLSLEELGGNLCVLCSKASQADVWVMTEYGDEASWSKMASVPYFNFSWSPSLYSKPLVIFPSEEILVVFKHRFVVDDRNFVVYDRKSNIPRFLEIRDLGDFVEADVYVESLVWPAKDEDH